MTEYGDSFFWMPLSERAKYSKKKRLELLKKIWENRAKILDKIKEKVVK